MAELLLRSRVCAKNVRAPQVTDAKRQKALRDRKIAQGLRQVLVWVPTERVEEIRQIAEKMREEHDKEV
jgi:maltose-binding protein MalE